MSDDETTSDKTTSYETTSLLPDRVVTRVLSLLPEADLESALRAMPDWTEAVTVDVMLGFVVQLRSATRLRGCVYCNPSKALQAEELTFHARVLPFLENVVPEQLVQDYGMPLRKLIIEAAASQPSIWIVGPQTNLVKWVLEVLRAVVEGIDHTLVVETSCCTAIVTHDDGEQPVTLRFKTQMTSLQDAFALRHVECLQLMLGWGACPDGVDFYTGRTMAHHAAMKGDAECLRVLHDGGADMTVIDREDMLAVHHAAAWGHIDCLQVLHDRGVDMAAPGSSGMSAVHHAAAGGGTDCLQLLRSWGVDMTVPGRFGMTAVHHAAAQGNVSCLQMLYDWGADMTALDLRGRSALYHASWRNQQHCLETLRNWGLGTEQKGADGMTTARYVARPHCAFFAFFGLGFYDGWCD